MAFYHADVVLRSANLSHDYFTHRMDRYIKISNNSTLANYFHELCELTARLSYALEVTSSPSQINIIWPKDNVIQPPDHSKATATEFNCTGQQMFQEFTDKWRHYTSLSAPTQQGRQVSIMPMIQMGPFGIFQETQFVIPRIICLAETLASSTGGGIARLDWTSGYFSILRDYKSMLLQSNLDVHLIAASPEVGVINFL